MRKEERGTRRGEVFILVQLGRREEMWREEGREEGKEEGKEEGREEGGEGRRRVRGMVIV